MPSIIKNTKKIYTTGSSAINSTNSRVTNLENNEYKITYFEIVSGTSGSLTIPTGATINAGEFGSSGNSILSKINVFNKPTYESPKTAGGVIVTSILQLNGSWNTTGIYTDPQVALIYSIKINAKDYHNLDYDRIIESEELDDVPDFLPPLEYNSNRNEVEISVANTIQDGYLTSTDWNRFDTVANNTSGINTGDETNASIGQLINDASSAGPSNGDYIAVSDTSVLKHVKWTDAKADFKTTFDTYYQPLDPTLTSLASYNINGILTQTAATGANSGSAVFTYQNGQENSY